MVAKFKFKFVYFTVIMGAFLVSIQIQNFFENPLPCRNLNPADVVPSRCTTNGALHSWTTFTISIENSKQF